MKIPAVKKLVEQYTIEELQTAEEAIVEGETPAIEIEGEDEGEQLTHVLAAIWIKEDLAKNEGKQVRECVRDYTQRVRKSIS